MVFISYDLKNSADWHILHVPDYLASLRMQLRHGMRGVRHVLAVLHKLRHLRRMLRLTSRATAGVGELVKEGGPVKKADDLRRVLEASGLQERVLGETKRTDHETEVLKHCK